MPALAVARPGRDCALPKGDVRLDGTGRGGRRCASIRKPGERSGLCRATEAIAQRGHARRVMPRPAAKSRATVALETLRFLAVIVTGVALIAPGAHLFALANKIGMTGEDYFLVQRIYLGWWLVGLALPAAFVIDMAFAVAARHDPVTFRAAGIR